MRWLVLCFVLLSGVASAGKPHWVEVATGADGVRFLVATDSIRWGQEGKTRLYKTATVEKKRKAPGAEIKAFEHEADCDGWRLRERSSNEGEWSLVGPNTAGDVILDLVCDWPLEEHGWQPPPTESFSR